ncbi:MAG: hypothetical protein NW201_14130 [Gemmatimonadales bacterium]|nr:hypothetical protein [Gemmatimonadales bacterium]
MSRVALTLIGLALVAGPVAAQGPGPAAGGRPPFAGAEGREALRERMRTMSPEERRALRDQMRERRQNLTPEQRAQLQQRREERLAALPPERRAYVQQLQAERARLRAQVEAGQLDRRSAGQELRQWRQANRPPRPNG